MLTAQIFNSCCFDSKSCDMASKCSSILPFSFLSASSSDEALSRSFAVAASLSYKQGEPKHYKVFVVNISALCLRILVSL